ncbi:MAG TPA: DnaJ domain-containing protein [Bryobacteraceae bacterium]|nr:DnaJ domain-containing protein [Bryobacteraceae bacterium]
MNYYEELGLRPDASPEEIHQAYRSLARLLHPDQQPDEDLRRLAEGQMKRLNAIHEALVEPSRRREYDAALGRNLALAPIKAACRSPRVLSFRIRDAGLLAAGIAVASIYWQVTSTPDRRAQPLAERTFAPSVISAGERRPNRPAAREAPSKRSRTQAPVTEGQAPSRPAIHELPPPAGFEYAGGPGGIEPVSLPQLKPAPEPAIAPVQPVVVDALPKFGGTWVYVRPRLLPDQRTLYPADYVETVVSEEGDMVRGRYRARYDVADRPISSEVAFRFEGRAEESGASLRWTGAGGAEGEAKLVLLSRNSMRVEWHATSLGSQLGLASGTAVLTRRQER